MARLALTGAFAFGLTALVSGIWAGLLAANLRANPAVPWSVAVMAAVLWVLWKYLGGRWWPRRTSQARRAHLRAGAVAGRTMLWALIAGVLSLVALTGLWILLFLTGMMRGNTLPDFSHYPVFTVVCELAMASLVGGVLEEALFRGYFQGELERLVRAPLAIALTAVVMAPAHASTQGFGWPTLVFYFIVDTMLGSTASLCDSIRPGVVVHTAGLLIFFTLVWPFDGVRSGAWFWIHVSQVIVGGALAILAFRRLAHVTASVAGSA
jgi:membrane protease YdiL (CAAX protease family)